MEGSWLRWFIAFPRRGWEVRLVSVEHFHDALVVNLTKQVQLLRHRPVLAGTRVDELRSEVCTCFITLHEKYVTESPFTKSVNFIVRGDKWIHDRRQRSGAVVPMARDTTKLWAFEPMAAKMTLTISLSLSPGLK